MPSNFFDCEISKAGHLVHKIKAKDSTGKWAYYFVLVDCENERQFLNALKSDEIIDLEEYGMVLASCYGETPNEAVKQFLKEKYDFIV